jgi:hypothetical protein
MRCSLAFVVLFGQHGADEADDGVTVGEDAHDVGAPTEFFVSSGRGSGDARERFPLLVQHDAPSPRASADVPSTGPFCERVA